MAEFKSKKFAYKNSIQWQGEIRGRISSSDKPEIEVSSPPEFRGSVGLWTPEDLLVASVNSCVMITFLFLARRDAIEISGYESKAEGVLEKTENGYVFTRITLEPSIYLSDKNQTAKAKELIAYAERNCLISKSIKSGVEIKPLFRQK